MRTIPKNLLIHSAVLSEISTDNTWQEEEKTVVAELSKIRIDTTSELVTTKDNRQVTLSAELFYDCRNSRPKNLTFKQGQSVLWNDMEYVIETVEPLYDGRKLHHYELGLI